MKLDKTKRKLLKTYALYAFLLLLVMPMLHFLFVRGDDISSRLRVAFLSQKLSIAAAVMVFVLIVMVMRTLFRFKTDKREGKYLIASVVLFCLSFATMAEFDFILKEGVRVTEKSFIDFDSQRLLNINAFNTLDKGAKFIPLENNSAKRTLYLDDLSKDQQISFIVYSENFTEANFSLVVNDYSFNVSGLSPDSKIKNLKFEVDRIFLAKENNVEIHGRGVSLLYESLFSEGNTFIYSETEGKWLPSGNEAMIYIRGTNSLIMDALFRLGIVFRLFGIFSLFIFTFGTEFTRKCIRQYKKEILASLLFTILLFLAIYLI
jgi:hypothetical protein